MVFVQAALLERTHSHNDYERSRPLVEALEAGLGSVEADLFLVDGKLLVAHSRKACDPKKDFESMYLSPLAKRVRENGGWVYKGVAKKIWLLIDIKANGAAVYAEVKKSLDRFPSLRSAVRPVISGDRPIDAIVADKGRWAGLDGRLPDLGKGYSVELMPWVSESWGDHFKWFGFGAFPADQAAVLSDLVAKVHAEGRKIRFWGGVDQVAFWDAQWKAGVDFINTDHPAKLRDWLVKQR